MAQAVGTLAKDKLEIIPGEFQRGRHVVIGDCPTALDDTQIMLSALQQDLDWFGFSTANEVREIVATPYIGE